MRCQPERDAGHDTPRSPRASAPQWRQRESTSSQPRWRWSAARAERSERDAGRDAQRRLLPDLRRVVHDRDVRAARHREEAEDHRARRVRAEQLDRLAGRRDRRLRHPCKLPTSRPLEPVEIWSAPTPNNPKPPLRHRQRASISAILVRRFCPCGWGGLISRKLWIDARGRHGRLRDPAVGEAGALDADPPGGARAVRVESAPAAHPGRPRSSGVADVRSEGGPGRAARGDRALRRARRRDGPALDVGGRAGALVQEPLEPDRARGRLARALWDRGPFAA